MVEKGKERIDYLFLRQTGESGEGVRKIVPGEETADFFFELTKGHMSKVQGVAVSGKKS